MEGDNVYILNVSQLAISEDKLFRTKSEILADWLMYQCKMPILGREDGDYIFMKTKALTEFLKLAKYWIDPTGLL